MSTGTTKHSNFIKSKVGDLQALRVVSSFGSGLSASASLETHILDSRLDALLLVLQASQQVASMYPLIPTLRRLVYTRNGSHELENTC